MTPAMAYKQSNLVMDDSERDSENRAYGDSCLLYIKFKRAGIALLIIN